MQPFPKKPVPKPGDIGPINKIPFDPTKLPKIPQGGWSPSCSDNPVQALLNKVQAPSSAAMIALIPIENSGVNSSALPDTSIAIKPAKPNDKTLKALVSSWGSALPVPNFTKAYATFSKVQFIGEEFDAILFLTNGKTAHIYLKAPQSEHVWTDELKLNYCKKEKLFFFTSQGYTMSIDFGI